MTVAPTDLALLAAPALRRGGLRTYFRRHPTMVIGGVLLSLMALMAIFAPYLGTVDPQALSPIKRLRWPSAQYWFGTDMLGRDIYSRTIYGARVSLTVGISVALLASGIGLAIGLLTGFSRWTDAIPIHATHRSRSSLARSRARSKDASARAAWASSPCNWPARIASA